MSSRPPTILSTHTHTPGARHSSFYDKVLRDAPADTPAHVQQPLRTEINKCGTLLGLVAGTAAECVGAGRGLV